MGSHKFHLQQADLGDKRWSTLDFRSYIDAGVIQDSFSDPVIATVCGDEIDDGTYDSERSSIAIALLPVLPWMFVSIAIAHAALGVVIYAVAAKSARKPSESPKRLAARTSA